MTIDKEKLVELLVEKTGLEPGQVEEQITELVKRIQKAASEGKTFEVKELGTFSLRDDQLHFEPDEKLSKEINNKYTGMEPIEMIGAIKDQPDNEEEEQDIPDTREAGEEEDEDPFGIEEKPRSLEEELKHAREREKQEAEELAEKEQSESKAEPEESEGVFDDLELEDQSDETRDDDHEGRDEQDETEEEQPQPVAAAGRTGEDKESDTIGTVLTVFAIVITIGLGGWVVYDLGVFSSLFGSADSGNLQAAVGGQDQVVETRKPETQTDPAAEEPAVEQGQQPEDSGGGDLPNDTGREREQGSRNAVQPNEEQDQTGEQVQQTYGLKGTVQEAANDGFTIVVFSLKNEINARGQRQRLSNDGYRTLLEQATVDGTVYYRVGVGQFETVRAAREAANGLPSPFNSNFFIKRINP